MIDVQPGDDVVPVPVFSTGLGRLYQGDCLEVLPRIADESADCVFADPPFDLGKDYPSGINDRKGDEAYLSWSKEWLNECCRVLKPGGALFVYNLPKWNILLGAHLMERLTFRHQIAIAMKSRMPIQGRLYPSHYSLLYFSKGKPRTFRRIRTPIETCRHCNGEIKDYGGHRGAMNDQGVSLSDVWTAVSPVRHWRFKSPQRQANQLSTKILDRVIEMSTVPGDVVLDPFMGAGTTAAVAESKKRRWVGIEVGPVDVIVERLTSPDLRPHENSDRVAG